MMMRGGLYSQKVRQCLERVLAVMWYIHAVGLYRTSATCGSAGDFGQTQRLESPARCGRLVRSGGVDPLDPPPPGV